MEKGKDRAKNAGEVQELFKLRMLLAEEQMDMAINKLWLEIQKQLLLIKSWRFQKSLPEGNCGSRTINRFKNEV